MGISGLLPALKPIQAIKHLSDYSGKTIAVDAYVWLHKGVHTCATELATGKASHKYVEYAMHRVRLLRYHGIKPYIVFDGGPLPAKKGTETEREQKREENRAQGKALLAQGKYTLARKCFVKCIDVSPQMAFQFIKALRAESVPYVVAPYEADAQLAYLERVGIADAILTEDSDLLVFGCQNVLYKLDPVASTVVSISRKDFGSLTASATEPNSISLLGWSDVQFREMAILSGCDYLPSIPGIGLITACSLLRKWKTADRVVRAVALQGKKTVPPDYWKQFQLADKCFLHQRVYCPRAEKLVHLTDIGDDWNDEFDAFVGSDLDPTLAKKIALGDVDPATYLPIEDINKGFQPHALRSANPISKSPAKSLKSKGKMRESLTPNAKPRPPGIMDFFGPNPIIPSQQKQKPTPVAKPNMTGKSSGKRTLVEVMEGMEQRKKPRQSYSPARPTQSKFFARRHSDLPGATASSALRGQDKENIPMDLELDDGSDLSVRAIAGRTAGSDVELELAEFPDVVEQEDGYISPSPSVSRDADDLSSPPREGKWFTRPRVHGRQVKSPTRGTGSLSSDEDDGNSFGADAVSSPVSVKRPPAFKSRIHTLQTPTHISPTRRGRVLVHTTPTPGKRVAPADIDEISSPPVFRGPDLRSMLDEVLDEDNLEPELGPEDTSSPSLSPETPQQGPSTQPEPEIIDVDNLEDDTRAAAERAAAVMVGWRARWAAPVRDTPSARKAMTPGARAGQLRRSETNVTPAGRHSLGRVARSTPPVFTVLPTTKGGASTSGGSKSVAEPRRSLVFVDSVKQNGTGKPAAAKKKDRQVVDLTISEDERILPRKQPADGTSEEYDILQHANVSLSQFRYVR